MPGPLILLLLAGLGLVGWLAGRARAAAFARDVRTSSLPGHHGWYVVIGVLAPALMFLGIWAMASPALVTDAVLANPVATSLPVAGLDRASILAEARALSRGRRGSGFDPRANDLAPVYAAAQSRYDWFASAATLLLALAGGAVAYARVRPTLAARASTERMVMAALLGASLVAVLTTIGIVASLMWEAGRFFGEVPVTDFLFGTHWSPQVIDPRDPGASLGAVPLFWGTIFIGAIIAMIVAIPLG